MVLCVKTWTWLILSLEVIQKSQTVNVNNLTNMFYEKTYVYMSNKFFNKNKIKIQSYMNTMYHNFISSIKNYFGGMWNNGASLGDNFLGSVKDGD